MTLGIGAMLSDESTTFSGSCYNLTEAPVAAALRLAQRNIGVDEWGSIQRS
jgi:hypothetical protein